MTFRSLATIAVVAFGIRPSLSPAQSSAQETGYPDLLKLVAPPLPAGAIADRPPHFYNPDTLYQYMDGGADIFVLYGLRTLLHLDGQAGTAELSIDIFDMGAADAAFGMYAAERSPDYHFVPFGAEGYENTGILNFVQDRFYVKLAGFGAGADPVLETWATTLSTRIGRNRTLPPLLSRLPVEHRKEHSEQYMAKDPLGHPFLGPAYLVSYAVGSQESKLLVTLGSDDADAEQRFEQLKEHFAKTGECKAAPEIGARAIRASNSFEGSVIARTVGRYLLVLLNPVSGSEAILKGSVERLQ